VLYAGAGLVLAGSLWNLWLGWRRSREYGVTRAPSVVNGQLADCCRQGAVEFIPSLRGNTPLTVRKVLPSLPLPLD
jgi:hypothetical protein